MKKYIRIHAVDVVNLKISGGMEYFGNERPFWTNGQHSKNLQEQFNQDTHQKQRQPQLGSPSALPRFLNESKPYCRRKLLSHHREGVRIHQCLRTPSKNSGLSSLIYYCPRALRACECTLSTFIFSAITPKTPLIRISLLDSNYMRLVGASFPLFSACLTLCG